MTIRNLLLTTAAAVALSAAPAFGQQPAPEKQQKEDIPTFSTDDVAPPQVVTPVETTEEPVDPSLTPEERADLAGEGEQTAEPDSTKKKGPSQAEIAWRQRYAQAKARAEAAERRAQEAEIRVTELRNQIAATTSADRQPILSELEQQGETVRKARLAAAAAKVQLAKVEAEGREKRFRPDPGPSRTTKAGNPNRAYYLEQFKKAKSDLADAERRITLYQYRVNDLRTRVNNNSGSGDQFTQIPLTQELNQALADLDKAKADRDAAQNRVEAARRQASIAGIPPGELR